jgi:hypothetical protein
MSQGETSIEVKDFQAINTTSNRSNYLQFASASDRQISNDLSSVKEAAGEDLKTEVADNSLSWISNLKDPVLKADFTSFYLAGGPITEADLAEAFGDLVSQVSASSSKTLTTVQLHDLRSIAKNIRSMGASDYLQFITDAFVNGNPADATWTGDQASPSPLLTDPTTGLQVGATSAQLQELVGKWFLGTDLPSDAFTNAHATPPTTQAVTYTANDGPLFGTSGPEMSDINQGKLNDCYLMASLAEVAQQDPAAITSMITDDGNGIYGVRFYGADGAPIYVTVNDQLSDIGSFGTNIWPSVIQTAYAEAQQQGLITGKTGATNNSLTTIGNGGVPSAALEAITGASEIETFVAGTDGWTSSEFTGSSTYTNSPTTVLPNKSNGSILSDVAADLLVGDDVVLGSETHATDSSGNKTLVAGHAFSVVGYDPSTQMLELRNPWGAGSGSSNFDEYFEASLKDLHTDGDEIVTDNVGQATSVPDAPAMAAAGLQKMTQIQSFAVSDSVPNIEAKLSGPSGLSSDSKLTSVSVNNPTAADSLNLTGLTATANVDMGGNSDVASIESSGSLNPLNLGSGYDSVTLGSGPSTIDYSFAGGGVENVSNFQTAHDLLSITLPTGSLDQTLVNGGDWISSSANSGEGVFLAGVANKQHVATAPNGTVTIS